MSSRELTVLIAMCAVWGFHFVIIKIGVAQLPPMFYAAIRMTLVAALLSPFLRWRPGQMVRVLSAALCMGAFNYAFMFTGVKFATASSSAVAIQLYTPFATILSMVILKDAFGWRRALGIAFAFAGVAIIALSKPESADPNARIGLGVGLIALGAFLEAIGAILVKQSKAFKPFELLAWFALVGAIGLWLLTFTLEEGQGAAFAASDKWVITGAILYSAIGGSIFGHTSYYWLLQRLPVSTVAASLPLTMIFAVLSGVVILGDPFGPSMIIGAAMTLAGVGFVILRNAKKQDIKLPVSDTGLAP